RLLTVTDRTLGNGILQGGAAFASILIPLYAELVESVGFGWRVVFWSVGVGGLLWVPLWLGLVGRGDVDEPPAGRAEAGPRVAAGGGADGGRGGHPRAAPAVLLAVAGAAVAADGGAVRGAGRGRVGGVEPQPDLRRGPHPGDRQLRRRGGDRRPRPARRA